MLSGFGAGKALQLMGNAAKELSIAGKVVQLADDGVAVGGKVGALNKVAAGIGKGLEYGITKGGATTIDALTEGTTNFFSRNIAKTARMLKGAGDINTLATEVNVLKSTAAWDTFASKAIKLNELTAKGLAGAGYESSVEANDYMKQAISNYVMKYKEEKHNPKAMPSDEEISAFKENLKFYANCVFVGNAALVGFGNALQMYSIFGAGINSAVDRAKDGFKILTREATEAGLKGAAKKTGRFLYGALKVPLYEGIVEEGGQGFIKNLGLEYADKTLNPGASADMLDHAEI